MIHEEYRVEYVADRVQTAGAGNEQAMIDRLYRLLLGRKPAVDERAAVRGQLAEFRRHFAADTAAARHGSELPDSIRNGQRLTGMTSGDPVLYLADPPGVSRPLRRSMLDGLARLHALQQARDGDPEIASRVAQYEMAFRMQASVPELTDLSGESAATFDRYGPESRKPGTFAANCLLARRLVERGVRFVQLYHRGWDQHNKLMSNIPKQCRDIDQPQAALVEDLAARGLLEETLVVWAGEFGRTVYGQGGLVENYGRDHHGRCFSIWMACGGVKPGLVHGLTDDYCYNILEKPVHIHDLNATLRHLLGVDHERLTRTVSAPRPRLRQHRVPAPSRRSQQRRSEKTPLHRVQWGRGTKSASWNAATSGTHRSRTKATWSGWVL